jgi:hypothetical protein
MHIIAPTHLHYILMHILLTIFLLVPPLHNLLVRTHHLLVFLKDLGFHIFPHHVVDIVGASYLPKILLTQVTPTQPLAHSSPFVHELGNIHASLFPHMHTPSALLGRSISQMAKSQVIQKKTVSQPTQPPSHTSQISTPYIGGQSSMGGQPSAGGKPSVAGKPFTRGEPTWFQHQQV